MATVTVTTQSGDIVVRGESRSNVVTEGRPGGSDDIVVRCPEGSDVVVGTDSGDVDLQGRLGQAKVTAASGSVTVEQVEGLEVRAMSGKVRVLECTGQCRVQATSGSVRIGRAGTIDTSCESGSIRVDRAEGGRVQAVSGSVEVSATGREGLVVRTMSGSVRVTLPPGVHPETQLVSESGDARCDCQQGSDCRVLVWTGSGSISVKPG